MNTHFRNSVTTSPPATRYRWCTGSSALRKGRWSQHQQAYLITTNTVRRQPLFHDFWSGREVVLVMKSLHDHGLLHSHAYVLMPDHLHWLFTLRCEELSSVIRQFKSRSARAVNRRSQTSGQLWQQGFHDHAIRYDESIIHAARYIVANPLRAKLVKTINDYPHWDAQWIPWCESS